MIAHPPRLLLATGLLALLAAPIGAQNVSLLFTGRFGFTSLDAANERAGGSLTQISEFDIAVCTPGANTLAHSWIPTTAHSAMWGDGHGDGNYTRFYQWKAYFDRFNFAGPFVKYADRAKNDPRLVYWTTRDNLVNKVFKVHTQNGAQQVQILPGDMFRFGANGNTEFFITRALILKAKGAPPPTRAESAGIGNLCQDALGNLYWSPEEGGHWVSGNNGPSLPVFCNDGGIIMLDAQDIIYDANGNVLDVVADKAHMLFEEVTSGPNGQPHIRGMVNNAGAYDYNGTLRLLLTPKMTGLALDPNGGTITSSNPVGTFFHTVPNFIFTWDSGSWGGTIFSTANNPTNNQPGSIAVINGVKCGSDTLNVAADGRWLGVKVDIVNFQPTLMGLAVINQLPYTPFVADAPNDGAILATDPAIYVDLYPGPVQPAYLLLSAGPGGLGKFQPSINVATNPLLSPESWKSLWTVGSVSSLLAGVSNLNGYLTWQIPNLWNPSLVGFTVVFQGLRPDAANRVILSNPVQMQFK